MRKAEKGIFLGLFFVSGACGLTYEIVWSRLLVFVFGGTTFAVTTVLTCFMGGLALGAWLAGRLREPRRPERLYGVLEIVIGLVALAVPVLMEWSAGLYRLFGQAVTESFALATMARVVVSGLILLVPTTAMGATLPLLVSAFSRRGSAAGGNVAALYGANTLGAFAGCAGAGFWLLPRLGLAGSTLTAALLNLAAGAVALMLSRRGAGEAPAADPTIAKTETKKVRKKKTREASPALSGRSLLWLYGLSGFAAMAYQVAWTRALILSMGSSTYSFSTIVSCYIFGLGAGSLAMARWVDRIRRPLSVAGGLQGVIALAALFVVPLFGELPNAVARVTSAAGVSFGSVLLLEAAWVLGLLIVPTLCMGALLPLVCRIYQPAPERAGRGVGDVYAANTAGTIAGAAVAGFVLIPWDSVGMERAIYLASGLNLWVGSCFLLARGQLPARKRREGWRYGVVAGAWLAAALSATLTEPWSRELMTSGPYLGRPPGGSGWDLIFYREGIDATVSVERSIEGELSLSVNGKADASSLDDDMLTQTLIGVLPMLQRPAAREVCLIGLGSGVSAGAILAFDVERLDVAEISRAVVRGSRFFDPVSRAPLDDPRAALHRADGRNFLELSERRYDVVISEPSNPWISGIANLFTREFFELSKSRLEPGGIHAQWLHGYSMDPADFAAVLGTLVDVFGHVQVWEMAFDDYLFLASDKPLATDTEGLFFSFAHPAVRDVMEQIRITHPSQLAHHYVSDGERLAPWIDGAGRLADDKPHLEFSAPRHLLAATQTHVAARLFAAAGTPRLTGDPAGVLNRRFAGAAERARRWTEHLRDGWRAGVRGDVAARVAALRDVVGAAPEDARMLDAARAEAAALAGAAVDVRDVEARLAEVSEDAWPFARRSPWPMAEALAYAGRQLVESGGDPEEAVAHLLRAWLRAPEDGRVIYDLARAYAARGDRERVLRLLRRALEAGFADPGSLATEPLFDAFRDDPAFPGAENSL